MNREQVENLKVGNRLAFTMDAAHGKALPAARYSEAREVVEITYRGVSDTGRAYVGGYTEFGRDARISFSIGEGDENYRVAPVVVCRCGHSQAQHTTDLAQYHPSNPHVMLCNIAACACRGFRQEAGAR